MKGGTSRGTSVCKSTWRTDALMIRLPRRDKHRFCVSLQHQEESKRCLLLQCREYFYSPSSRRHCNANTFMTLDIRQLQRLRRGCAIGPRQWSARTGQPARSIQRVVHAQRPRKLETKQRAHLRQGALIRTEHKVGTQTGATQSALQTLCHAVNAREAC